MLIQKIIIDYANNPEDWSGENNTCLLCNNEAEHFDEYCEKHQCCEFCGEREKCEDNGKYCFELKEETENLKKSK